MNAPLKLVVRPHVPDDLRELAEYLDTQSDEQGDLFILAAIRTFQQLREFPGIGSPKLCPGLAITDLRSWAVQGYPNHLIYYHSHGGAVVVFAVLHGSRDVRKILRRR